MHDDNSLNELSSVMVEEALRTLDNTVGAALEEKAATMASDAHHDHSVSELSSVMDEEALRTLQNTVESARQETAQTTATTVHQDNSVSALSSIKNEEQLCTSKTNLGQPCSRERRRWSPLRMMVTATPTYRQKKESLCTLENVKRQPS